ncbi:SDR family NAD(P)-dependent oxidoreductase [Chondromyces apiculatus]|uniref:Putative short-chain dehydrogenase n=1 Tax=Chondromyces apiculatus DSM 436 TaxID=1192034 RepID=A0A017SVI8_9BACT|nr:SDR family oxidoreductase [Chondromyces apiculatus]EYF00979.1 putative short-chain dehydrogenase [Chondromyces apiculatus DSM 436]
MTSPLDQGVVLITGASSGIGRALALRLGPRAKALVLAARRKDRLEALREELTRATPALNVLVVECDVTDRTQTDAMVTRIEADLGGVDVLVNNAGYGDLGAFDLADWQKTERMIALNVTSLTYLTHRVLRRMVARRRGGVMNVSSGFGLTFGPGMAAYIGTKHFVSGFTEGLRLDLAGTGVRVMQVCPGPVATEFHDTVGNFTGMDVPGLLMISAETCAAAAIRGFDRGRALVVPGFLMRVLLFLGGYSPRWLLRVLYAPAARALRRKQLAIRAGS